MAVTRINNGDVFYGSNMDSLVLASCMRFASAAERTSVMVGDLAPYVGAASVLQDSLITYRYVGATWAPAPGTVLFDQACTVAQSIPPSAGTALTGWNVDLSGSNRNFGNWFNPGSGVFQPTAPGYYEFNASCYLFVDSHNGGRGFLGLLFNNGFLQRSQAISCSYNGATNSYILQQMPTATVYLNGTTDNIQVGIYQTSGYNLNISYTAGYPSQFHAKYLGG